jgi:hypothetical protein
MADGVYLKNMTEPFLAKQNYFNLTLASKFDYSLTEVDLLPTAQNAKILIVFCLLFDGLT